jgi:hypothetical protein
MHILPASLTWAVSCVWTAYYVRTPPNPQLFEGLLAIKARIARRSGLTSNQDVQSYAPYNVCLQR